MSTAELLAWLIFALPLLAFLSIGLVFKPWRRLCGYITVGAIGGSFLLSLYIFGQVLSRPEHVLDISPWSWFSVGDVHLEVGLTVDSLTAVMLIVVTAVSLLVQIYSQGYMHGDPGYSRYFAFMSLFTASMLGLVLASNLLMVYIFWEGVGLGSYLLIGFWYQRPSAAAAAKKAFIVTRFGDFGFLLAILYAYTQVGTLDIPQLYHLAIAGTLGGTTLTLIALGTFSGAVGKSAQFPLHVWLPDAMEGPTPVSALIHAATMVAAGVYLVARLFPLFEHSAQAMNTVAAVGAFTAIFAASMGLVANDIKRVLAYSTVSQLGYMMLGLGVGGYVAGMFHLFNHAFFKALLFLGSGSVNHTTGTFDMRYMGGLRRHMPITFWTFLIASLALAGIFPFSGFWSKDEVLTEAFFKNPLLFWTGLAAAFMTAFYIFRAIFMTFTGEYRGGAAAEAAARGQGSHGSHGPEEHYHLHESPPVMTVPLILLAIPSVISGFANAPQFLASLGLPVHFFGEFLETPVIHEVLKGEAPPEFNFGLAGLSLGVALLGIFVAYAVYGAKWVSNESMGNALKPLYVLLYRKYFFDELYEGVVVRGLLYTVVAGLLSFFDRFVVDGVVNGTAWVARTAGSGLRRLETGQLQFYGLMIFTGVLVIMALFMIRG